MASVGQMFVMAAIVATLLYVSVGAAAAVLLAVLGTPFRAFVTFGGALDLIAGLLAWWVAMFAVSCVYGAWVFPWKEKVLEWPDKN